MLDDSIFMLHTLKSFINIGIINIDDFKLKKFKSILISSENFLSLTEKDRSSLLLDSAPNNFVFMFLNYLENMQCDNRYLKHYQIMLDHIHGSLETVFHEIVNRVYTSSCDKITLLKYCYQKIKILFELGFEKYFFNLKEELFIYCNQYFSFTFLEALYYFDKTYDTIALGNNEVSDNIKIFLKHEYECNKNNLNKIRLLVKMLSVNIEVTENLDYEALAENGTIYIKYFPKIYIEHLKILLYHEAAHMLFHFEERFEKFFEIYKRIFDSMTLRNVWIDQKERSVDEYVKTFCDIKIMKRYITDPNFNDTNSLITSVLISLKKITDKTRVGSIWK